MKREIEFYERELTGLRKLKEKANHAATVLIYGGQTEGSYFTERGKRTNRGVKIN